MSEDFTLICPPCGTRHVFETSKEKIKHKRNVTKPVAHVYYPNSPGSSVSTLHNILRAADKEFHCIRCRFNTRNSESIRKHGKRCYEGGTISVAPPQALPASPSPPSLPSTSLISSASSSSPVSPLTALSSSPALSVLLDTVPSSTPASSIMSLEVPTSPCEPLGSHSLHISVASSPPIIESVPLHDGPGALPIISESFNSVSGPPFPSLLFSSSSMQLHHTVTIAPPLGILTSVSAASTSNSSNNLAPSTATAPTDPLLPIPIFDRTLSTELKAALERLGSTCPLCWLRKRPCSHGIWECSHNQKHKYATSGDQGYIDFRDAINCSAYTHCYGCYIPQKCSYSNHGRRARFHSSMYGRRQCPWRDTLLPLAYLVFISARLRKLFTDYNIANISFTSASQTEFLDWFMNTDDSEKLPPALFILYVLKNEFGMPPPLPQCSNPVAVDPFA